MAILRGWDEDGIFLLRNASKLHDRVRLQHYMFQMRDVRLWRGPVGEMLISEHHTAPNR